MFALGRPNLLHEASSRKYYIRMPISNHSTGVVENAVASGAGNGRYERKYISVGRKIQSRTAYRRIPQQYQHRLYARLKSGMATHRLIGSRCTHYGGSLKIFEDNTKPKSVNDHPDIKPNMRRSVY